MKIDGKQIKGRTIVIVDEPSMHGGVFEVEAVYNETVGAWGFDVFKAAQIKPPKEWAEKYPNRDVTKTQGFITPNDFGFKAFNKLFGDYELKLKI